MKKTVVYEKFAKQRVDKFLKEEFFLDKKKTRGEIVRQIKDGNVLVDGKGIKPSHLLKQGEKVEFDMTEEVAGLAPNKNVKFGIISQDENMLVVDKPAGLQVHPSSRNEKDTLVNGLLYRFPEISDVGDAPKTRPGIVHRLDRGTSGVMVVARNQEIYSWLKKKFKEREMRKKYWAVVYGEPSPKGIIDAPLARAANYKKQIIAGKKTRTKIRSAVTEYETLKTFQGMSLLEVFPRTGRTHQIRVHLTSIGHPIVGDEKYARKQSVFKSDAARLLLHAKSLTFEEAGKKYKFEAPLPDDFRVFLEKTGLLPEGLTLWNKLK